MNEHTRGIFSQQFIRASESLKLWEKGMYPEFENDQRSGYSGRTKWDCTDLDHKSEDKDELVVTFEVAQLYMPNLMAISREGWQASSRKELTDKLRNLAKRTNNGKEPPRETFLRNQDFAPDMVRGKCALAPEAKRKVKLPVPENVFKGGFAYQPNQNNNILQELRGGHARVSQVTLAKKPKPEENSGWKARQDSEGKWNSSAVFSEEKHKLIEDRVDDMSDAEIQRVEAALARRKKKSEPNDDVCINGKGCKSDEWQQASAKQAYQNSPSGTNQNDWNGWKDPEWQEARNLQQAYDVQKERQWNSTEQTNEPSESSDGRKRSGDKVPVESMASATWSRKKFAIDGKKYWLCSR